MKNSKCEEMICKKCGKDMILDQIEPYDNKGSNIFYFYCSDNNCKGRGELVQYHKVNDGDYSDFPNFLASLFSRKKVILEKEEI